MWPDPKIAAGLIAQLRRFGLTLATCESLTGGLLGAAITAVPGASEVYRGGLITYATEIKHTLAQVPVEVLTRDGAVSAATAKELALAALHSCGADVAVALTGVAGPDPQEGKPPGTVWQGLAWVGQGSIEEVRAEKVRLAPQAIASGRGEVRAAACEKAMVRLTELCRSGLFG